MASVRKFTFDLRFDEDDGNGAPAARRPERTIAAPPPPPPPPPPPEPEPVEPAGPPLIYSEEDMEVAREEAYVAGHMRALEEAQAATEQAMASAMMACRDSLGGLMPVITASTDQLAELASQVAAEICRKLLPHTSEKYAIQEICALVRSLMPNLTGQPRLLVRVHPDLINGLREPLDNIALRSGFEGKVVILEGENMALSDARVEWPDGGAERNTTRLWGEIDELIERNIPHFTRDEALELPDDGQNKASSMRDEPSPWPGMDDQALWSPPSPHDDLQIAPLPAFHSSPAEQAPSGKDTFSEDDFSEAILANLGFGPADESEDFNDGFPDLDGDLALTPEQEAELAALDASLTDEKTAAIDGEQS